MWLSTRTYPYFSGRGFGEPKPKQATASHAEFMDYIVTKKRYRNFFLKSGFGDPPQDASEMQQILSHKAFSVELRQVLNSMKPRYKYSNTGQLYYLYCDRVDQSSDINELNTVSTLIVQILDSKQPELDAYFEKLDKKRRH